MRTWLTHQLDRLIAWAEARADEYAPDHVKATAKPEATMSVRVIRANGQVEDRGVVSRSVLTRLGAKRLAKEDV